MNDMLQKIRAAYEAAGDKENAYYMKKYMKNQFEFFGIKAPERRLISKPFIKQSRILALDELEDLTLDLWKQDERELQYIAVEILQENVQRLSENSADLLEILITSKSWWDTVDGLSASVAGGFFKKFPELIPSVTDSWIDSGNMWLQRSAILFQLKYKSATNKELLFRYIRRLSDSREFFIQKAIGWALREYSKTSPEDVISFVALQELKPLSKREALRIILAVK